MKRPDIVTVLLTFFLLPLGNRWVNASMIVLILIGFIFGKRKDYPSLKSGFSILIPALLWLVCALSLMVVEHRDEGMAQLETKLAMLLLPTPLWLVFARDHVRHEQAFVALILGTLVAAVACFAYAAWRYFGIGGTVDSAYAPSELFSYNRLSEPIMHPAYLSMFCLVSLSVLLFRADMLMQSMKPLRWGMIGFLVVFIWMLNSRMQLIILFVLLMLFLFQAIRTGIGLRDLMITLAVVVGFLFVLPGSWNAERMEDDLPDTTVRPDAAPSKVNSSTARLLIWKSAWTVIGERPWFGHGVGDNRKALMREYERVDYLRGLKRRQNAHNQYLETWMTVGIPGLLLLIAWLVQPIWFALKRKNLLIFSIAIIPTLSFLTESMLERAWGVAFLSCVFPLLLSWGRKECTDEEKR